MTSTELPGSAAAVVAASPSGGDWREAGGRSSQSQEKSDLDLSDTESADEGSGLRPLRCPSSSGVAGVSGRKSRRKKSREPGKTALRKGSGSSVSRSSVEENRRQPRRTLSGASSDGVSRLRSSLTNSTTADSRRPSVGGGLSSSGEVFHRSKPKASLCQIPLRGLTAAQPSKAQWEALPIATREAIASQLKTQHELLQKKNLQTPSSPAERTLRQTPPTGSSLAGPRSAPAADVHLPPSSLLHSKPSRGSCQPVVASQSGLGARSRRGVSNSGGRSGARRSASATAASAKEKAKHTGPLCPHGLRYRSLCFFCSSPDAHRAAASTGGSRLLQGTVASRSRRSAVLSEESSSLEKGNAALGEGGGRRKGSLPTTAPARNGQLPASPDGLPSRQGGGRRRQGSEPRVFERLWGDAMAKQRAQSRQQREGSKPSALWAAPLARRASPKARVCEKKRTQKAAFSEKPQEAEEQGLEVSLSENASGAVCEEAMQSLALKTEGASSTQDQGEDSAWQSFGDALHLASKTDKSVPSQAQVAGGQWVRLNGPRPVFTPRSRTPRRRGVALKGENLAKLQQPPVPASGSPLPGVAVPSVFTVEDGAEGLENFGGEANVESPERPPFFDASPSTALPAEGVDPSMLGFKPQLPSEGLATSQGRSLPTAQKAFLKTTPLGVGGSSFEGPSTGSFFGSGSPPSAQSLAGSSFVNGMHRVPSSQQWDTRVRPATLKSVGADGAVKTSVSSGSRRAQELQQPMRLLNAGLVSESSLPPPPQSYGSLPFWPQQPLSNSGSAAPFFAQGRSGFPPQYLPPFFAMRPSVVKSQTKTAAENDSRRTSSTAASPMREFSASSTDASPPFPLFRNPATSAPALHLQTRPLLQQHPVYTPQGFSTAGGM